MMEAIGTVMLIAGIVYAVKFWTWLEQPERRGEAGFWLEAIRDVFRRK